MFLDTGTCDRSHPHSVCLQSRVIQLDNRLHANKKSQLLFLYFNPNLTNVYSSWGYQEFTDSDVYEDDINEIPVTPVQIVSIDCSASLVRRCG